MYQVVANLCDGNDYVAHWDGGVFDNIEDAIDFYNVWMPPEDEVQAALKEGIEMGDDLENYDLQVGVWDEDGDSHAFYSEGF